MSTKLCENCQKEHDGSFGSGRFCSSKCSHSFSTKNKRLEINLKVSKKLTKIKKPIKCKICGQEICQSSEICKSHFFKKPINLKKLGFDISTIGTKDVYIEYKKVQKYLFDLYHSEKKSFETIMKLHDIKSTRTLDLLFNFFKIEKRSLKESNKLSYLLGRNLPPSNPKFKHGYHTSWNKQQFYYRSSYELDYMKELDKNKILYEYEKIRIKYEDSQANTWRVAVPDFYLPESNTLVEIKSNYTYNKKNMEDKVTEYKKLGFNFKLVLEHQEYDYCV